MSEPLYLVLAAAALALACAADPAEATYNGRRLMALALASGVLAAAAYLARTIGLSLLAAVPLAWAMNRRWKCAALAAVAPVLALVGWRAWYLYATGFNMANPVYKAIGYDLNYNAWIPALGTVGRVVYHNVADLALALFDLLLPWWPEDDKKQMLAQGLSGAWPLYLGMVASIGLAVVGLAATWKRARPAIHFYLLFYTVLVLAWPFRTLRFIIPILPLVITLQLVGLYVLGLWLFDRVTGRTKQSLTDRWSASRPGANFALRFVVVPVLVLGYVHFLPLAGFGKKINPRPGVWQSEREPLVDLICAQTPRDAVISSNSGGYFYLRTGRKFVPPLPNTDLLDVLYPDDRTFLQCGQVVTPGMFAADLRYTRTQLEPYIRAAGITFLVPMELRGNSYWAVLNELKEREPGRFRLVGQTPIYELYQVSPPRR